MNFFTAIPAPTPHRAVEQADMRAAEQATEHATERANKQATEHAAEYGAVTP